MASVRFYAPISDGAFLDRIDDLTRGGATVTMQSPHYARCTWRGARFNVVQDVDGVRVQLLEDGGMGVRVWDLIESVLLGSQHVGLDWQDFVFPAHRALQHYGAPIPTPYDLMSKAGDRLSDTSNAIGDAARSFKIVAIVGIVVVGGLVALSIAKR